MLAGNKGCCLAAYKWVSIHVSGSTRRWTILPVSDKQLLSKVDVCRSPFLLEVHLDSSDLVLTRRSLCLLSRDISEIMPVFVWPYSFAYFQLPYYILRNDIHRRKRCATGGWGDSSPRTKCRRSKPRRPRKRYHSTGIACFKSFVRLILPDH